MTVETTKIIVTRRALREGSTFGRLRAMLTSCQRGGGSVVGIVASGFDCLRPNRSQSIGCIQQRCERLKSEACNGLMWLAQLLTGLCNWHVIMRFFGPAFHSQLACETDAILLVLFAKSNDFMHFYWSSLFWVLCTCHLEAASDELFFVTAHALIPRCALFAVLANIRFFNPFLKNNNWNSRNYLIAISSHASAIRYKYRYYICASQLEA